MAVLPLYIPYTVFMVALLLYFVRCVHGYMKSFPFLKQKSKLVVQSMEIKKKRKMLFWLEKNLSKVENTLLQWILETILENQTFQRKAKFIMRDFYEMNFMKGIVILVKVDEMYNILKSTSHCLLVERWDGNGWSNSFC